MTNEQAIKLLHRLQDEQFDGIHGDERREALEMAVRALSGEGDTISRQEVDKIIDDLLENDNLQASPSVWNGLHMIKQLPSAQPQCKTGAWIVIDDAERKYQCDECKAMSYTLGNFCPNCGADMRGGDAE